MKLIVGILLFAACITPALVLSQGKNKVHSDWPAYGRDAGGSRYSSLSQVNDKNVGQLKVAWTFQTGELKTYEGTKAQQIAAFEATPLMIDGTLYFSTPTNRVFAVDAVTGKEKWVYDPKVDLRRGFSEITSRGVSSWPAADDKRNNKAARRIFVATIDGRLIGLDAKSGKPISSFGKGGTVDLKEGLGNDVSVTSPPAIIGNKLIVGSSFGDNQTFYYPRGTVRAYDVITGKLGWSWNPNPSDSADKAWQTWKGPIAHKAGAANAWAVISTDVSRDLVFIPTSCPSVDYYGGDRLGQNLYANSIVAVRASTGKVVWYFQVVHHDLWDYDIAAQPVLIDVSRDGKQIPAVAVGTKMGHIFILNRETGQSLFPVEERPVPSSTVPGEEAWPTQPFPVLPAPLGRQAVTQDDAWGLTEKDKEESRQRIVKYINKGIFTPPSHDGTLVMPGNVGGINWGGMCFDQKNGLLITCINQLPAIIRMLPRDKVSEIEKDNKELVRSETGRQQGTPYVMKRDLLFKIDMGQIVPQFSPPWGTLVAIDVKDGSRKWEVPVGYMMDPKKFPGAEKWGSISLGGPMVTAGNLVFVAATYDGYLRAFNTTSGELLWEYLLPAGGQAVPMTYAVNGKQYIVIAAGGHGKFGTKMGDYIVAFALE